MIKLSVTSVLGALFVGYIFYSTYSLFVFLNPSQCRPVKQGKDDNDDQQCLNPAFKNGDIFQLFLCTSLDDHPLSTRKLDCFYHNSSFTLFDPLDLKFEISLPKETVNNGSLYFHAFLTKLLSTRELTGEVIQSKHTISTVAFLTKYVHSVESIFKNFRQTSSDKALPSDSKDSSSSKSLVTHWKSRLVLNGLSEPFSIPRKSLPYELLHLIQLNKQRYMPLLYASDVRQHLHDIKPLPSSSSGPVKMPLEILYEPITFGRFRLTMIIEKSFRMMKSMGFGDKEIEDVKGIFFETNHFLLILTILIASFHALFDFLAFKSDIQFWRHRRTMEGLSLNSVLWRFISQLVITLYLWNRDSSFLVLIPSAIGTLIELWKLKKVARAEWRGFRFVRDGLRQPTKSETQTQQIDSVMLKWLNLYILPPVLLSGTIYSMLYVKHESIYSWAIDSAVKCVYVIGFIAMLPQLYLNYRLKSVAHLPWRAFMYKAFNTFIDDFFAFLIPSVPTMHRLATFRDDIIFLIYLYQRWLYPIDKSRSLTDNDNGNVSETQQTDKKLSSKLKKKIQ